MRLMQMKWKCSKFARGLSVNNRNIGNNQEKIESAYALNRDFLIVFEEFPYILNEDIGVNRCLIDVWEVPSEEHGFFQ